MKLSERTLTILKNFSKFNDGILIPVGSTLKTMTAQRNVFVTASVEESFEVEVPLYNVTEFLAALTLFKDPDLEFTDTCVEISAGTNKDKQSIQYHYADKSVIIYPEKDIKIPKFDLEFPLSAANLESVLNAGRVLNLPNVTLTTKDGDLIMRAQDAANPSSNKFDVVVGEAGDTPAFEVNFKMENLRLLELDYTVGVSFKGIAEFKNEKFGISYAVGLAVSTAPKS